MKKELKKRRIGYGIIYKPVQEVSKKQDIVVKVDNGYGKGEEIRFLSKWDREYYKSLSIENIENILLQRLGGVIGKYTGRNVEIKIININGEKEEKIKGWSEGKINRIVGRGKDWEKRQWPEVWKYGKRMRSGELNKIIKSIWNGDIEVIVDYIKEELGGCQRREQRWKLRSLIRRLGGIYEMSDNCGGMRIEIRGRIGGNKRALKIRGGFGSIGLSEIGREVKYRQREIMTEMGVIGIKVWYIYKSVQEVSKGLINDK